MNDPAETAEDSSERGNQGAALTLRQVVGSTLASAFGVQSRRNRERDFRLGKASHFIVAGIVFTVLFVLGMILFVNLILSTAA